MEGIAQTANRAAASATPEPNLNKPLLTLDELAFLLDRTPKGLSDTLHGATDLGKALRSIRVKLGRRVYFRKDRLDSLIDAATGAP